MTNARASGFSNQVGSSRNGCGFTLVNHCVHMARWTRGAVRDVVVEKVRLAPDRGAWRP